MIRLLRALLYDIADWRNWHKKMNGRIDYEIIESGVRNER